MIIFINNKSTKFCQITLHIERFIRKRKVVPFFCLTVYIPIVCLCCAEYLCTVCPNENDLHCNIL